MRQRSSRSQIVDQVIPYHKTNTDKFNPGNNLKKNWSKQKQTKIYYWYQDGAAMRGCDQWLASTN
jgi:hypothetical protein